MKLCSSFLSGGPAWGGMLCFSPAMNPHQGSALGRFVERANTLMTKKKKKKKKSKMKQKIKEFIHLPLKV